VKPPEPFDMVGLTAEIDAEHFHPSVRATVERSARADRHR
jgi:hypothetical protein